MINYISLYGLLISILVQASSSYASVENAIGLTPQIYVEQSGIFEVVDPPVQSFNANATVGYESVVKTKFVEEAVLIPLQRDAVFGFNYVVVDLEADSEWVVVDVEISHPPITNYLGYKSNGFIQQATVRMKEDGHYHNGIFYLFSEDYEMVPGEWKITVRYQNRFEVSKRFFVGDETLNANNWHAAD